MDTVDLETRLRRGLYRFDFWYRRHHELTLYRTGFFQPFNDAEDLHLQWKSCIVAPYIGVTTLASSCLGLMFSLLQMAISIPCISPSLFVDGALGAAESITAGIVTPIVALAVTIGSLVSLATRMIATLFDFNLGHSDHRFLSFLPPNPYDRLIPGM